MRRYLEKHSIDPTPGLFAALACGLLAGTWRSGVVLGTPGGEAWGRMFVAAQVRRWLTGEATAGRADLLAFPEGMPFWPVDPVVQVFQVPLGAWLGEPRGLVAVAAGLLFLAGVGPYALARTAGASRLGALATGLLVQLSTPIHRNLREGILEVAAVGLLALAARACLLALKTPGWRRLLSVGLFVALLAGTSPYYAVYLALGCAFAALCTPGRWRRWLGITLAGALACTLVAGPLVVLEGGEDGRLGSEWRSGGFHPAPSVLLQAEVGEVDGDVSLSAASLASPDPPGPKTMGVRTRPFEHLVHRLPGGMAILLALALGLGVSSGRSWALLSAAFFVTGPGLLLLLRLLGIHIPLEQAPLGRLLDAVPLTSVLGNPSRLVVTFLLPAAVAGGLAASRRWPWVVLLVGVAVADLTITLKPAIVPSFPYLEEPAVLAALHGPTVVFPSGDRPCWNPEVGPKEPAYLASRAGVPIATDYGRGRPPADLPVQVGLSRISGVPIGEHALKGARTLELGPPAPFRCLLVLEDRLPPAGRERLLAWLAAHSDLLARGDRSSAWRIPEGGWTFPALRMEEWQPVKPSTHRPRLWGGPEGGREPA
ncbi:MAG: hypothetical protein JXB39_07680 [Deltaproteobacteria bacterium]|nr:hypothetical protein [Deltaproteobacteria bacterium]